MKRRRLSITCSLLKGIIAAILITLAGMLIMAAAVVFLGMSDTLIRILNQVLKVCSVALGAWLAVGLGGERGFLTGAGVGAVYALMGYVLYILLGGGSFDIVELLGEMTVCVAAGALTGAVCANLRPRKHAA